MEYTLEEVFCQIAKGIDVVYLIDEASDTYVTLKDNELFHNIFGSEGSYNRLLSILFENSVDDLILKSSSYRIFAKSSGKFNGNIERNARLRFGNKEIFVSLSIFSAGDNKQALLISEIKEKKQGTYREQQINAIKSAYLFIMNVDLIADKCSNMNMSEIDYVPANELDVAFSQWRKMIINMFLPEDQERFLRITDPAYLRQHLSYQSSKSVDFQMMNLQGEFIWVKLIFSRINTGDDNDFKFIFMVENNHDSHIRLLNDLKKYENLANRDSLTSVLNHGRIDMEIKESMNRNRLEEKPVSLIMFDIDDFKNVNDTYGHARGDYVLTTLSDIASKHLSTYGGKLGRWGGEEFIAVCENIDCKKSVQIAEELRKKIAEFDFDTVGNITSSFGVIQVQSDETPSSAFERIDSALYQAKNDGKNRVIVG